jgi:hypothetical protein
MRDAVDAKRRWMSTMGRIYKKWRRGASLKTLLLVYFSLDSDATAA